MVSCVPFCRRTLNREEREAYYKLQPDQRRKFVEGLLDADAAGKKVDLSSDPRLDDGS